MCSTDRQALASERALTSAQREAVLRCIAEARIKLGHQREDVGGYEAYAYQTGPTIHWGFNGPPHGFCIARGTVEK